jgi:regulatory protein
MEKGVAPDDIDGALAALAETAGNTDFTAAVNLARRRRLGPYRPLAARAEMREKDLAALARAGFSYDIARRVVDAATAEDPELFD